MKISASLVCRDLQAIRQLSPLIHNITNYVVMEHTANSLLAVGASPVMTHAVEEAADMVHLAGAVVLNMGTLNPLWELSATLALQTANSKSIPVVFDPVGAGATSYRTSMAASLLKRGQLTAIRGNASEMIAVSGGACLTKGVDASHESIQCIREAQALASQLSCVIIISGAVDVVVNGSSGYLIHNGHPLMSKVTGMGCAATSLIGAFLAVNRNPLLASVHAMCATGIAGEIAAQKSSGPGSFKPMFFDALYGLSLEEIEEYLRSEML